MVCRVGRGHFISERKEKMEFRTKDAEEATFYWMQDGIRFTTTDLKRKRWKNVIWFVFETDMTEEQLEALRTDYWNGATKVEPRAYAQKRAEIKNIIKENIFKRL